MLIVRFCDPGDIENGEEGEIVTPAGRPVTLTDTVPTKPFTASTVTVVSRTPPGVTVAELGEAERVKSGLGAGPLPPEEPPPQPVVPAARVQAIAIYAKRIKQDGTALPPLVGDESFS